MLIYIIGTFLLGVFSTVRSAAETGYWLTYLQSACPAWVAHLATAAAKRRRLFGDLVVRPVISRGPAVFRRIRAICRRCWTKALSARRQNV
jgi:hypothetical protein